MTSRSHPGGLAAALALAGAVAGCGAVATATAPPNVATTAPATRLTAAARPSHPVTAIDRKTAVARHQYTLEAHGGAALGALHRVGRDPKLRRLLQSQNASATRAYVQQQFSAVWYHWHVSHMRILQGSHVVVETGVPFVVAPSQMTLRGTGGRTLGTLQVSIQDVIGFVRFMHRNHAVDVVVRGQRAGHVRTSLPAAARAHLPSTGSVTIAGRRYTVRSFHQTAWDNEPVTVWILVKG